MIGNQRILIYLWSQREKFCVLLFAILDKTNFFELFLSFQSDDVGYREYTLMLKMLLSFSGIPMSRASFTALRAGVFLSELYPNLQTYFLSVWKTRGPDHLSPLDLTGPVKHRLMLVQ